MKPLQSFDWQIAVDERDLPEDRYSDHVNNARYFAFINQTFQGWYRAMGIRDRTQPLGVAMVHSEYDFLAEVKPPGRVRCRITVTRVGRSSMDHAVEMWDETSGTPVQVGRGKVVHVWMNRAAHAAQPWPAELLDKCWDPT